MAHAAPKAVTIGVVADGDWFVSDAILGSFEDEITLLLEGEFEARFPESKRFVGEWNEASVGRALDRALADDEVDLILGMGLIATHLAGKRDALAKPLVGPVVVDPEVQGLPYVQGRGVSGKRNFTYVTNPLATLADLEAFKRVAGVRNVVHLVTEGYPESVPSLGVNTQGVADELGIQLSVQSVGARAEDALAALPSGIDGVYVGALLALEPGQLEELAQGLADRGLPSFGQMGLSYVEAGLFMGIAVGYDVGRRARRVALDVQRILLGEAAADLPVLIRRTERLVINMSTARSIGRWPDWSTMAEAQLVAVERTAVKRNLTLREAARTAVERNLDYLANVSEVDAGQKNIALARARLFPQLGLGANGTIIDSDRTGSVANQGQTQIVGTLTAQQALYTESIYADLEVAKRLQASTVLQREALRLDVLAQVTSAYLDVLRTLTLERIRKENLRVTRSNRELAVVRRQVGVAGPSEVYRWDSQRATEQAQVIEAIAARNAAEIELNRVLDAPLEEPFDIREADLSNPSTLLPRAIWRASLENPYAFRIFRRFMVEVGLEASPELRAVDEVISATERQRTAAQRSWWLPDFTLQAQAQQILAQGGAGSGQPPDMVRGLGIPIPDDTSWSASIVASYPLFTGLQRLARVEQASAELQQQQVERRALAQRIEQRIRAALHFAGSGYANIGLSKEAAEAANENLEVVQDAYGRGSLGYLELLDAQEQALVARQVAANAVYDFLGDLVQVQRAASRFMMLDDAGAQAELAGRMQAFFEREGFDLSPRAKTGEER